MTLTEKLMIEIEFFILRHDMAATSFGLLSCRDAHAVRRLRAGRGLTMRRAEILREFMSKYDQEHPVRRPQRRKGRARERAAA